MRFNLPRLAWRNIRSRRARSWLTILGVLIGVTAVVALISIGTGVENAVLKQFADIGYDVVLLVPRGDPGAGGMPLAQLGVAQGAIAPSTSSRTLDPDLLRQDVPAISDVGLIGTRVLPVSAGDLSGFVRVSAPSRDLIDRFSTLVGGFKVAEGRLFATGSSGDVVLGARSAETLGVSVGQSVTLGDQAFTVVGILAPSTGSRGVPGLTAGGQAQTVRTAGRLGAGAGAGTFRAFSNTDDAVFVSYEQAQTLWKDQPMTSLVVVRIRAGISVSDTIPRLSAALARQGVAMTPISTQEIADSIQKTLGMLKTVLASIAAIALIVGAVGMMNTMYTAVLERTREIGILKAIGAKDRQVLGLFLIDSGLMGLIGGILGLLIGAGLSFIGTSLLGRLMAVTTFSPAFTPGLFLGVVGFSFVLGALAGAWPAWHAARLNPVEALASE